MNQVQRVNCRIEFQTIVELVRFIFSLIHHYYFFLGILSLLYYERLKNKKCNVFVRDQKFYFRSLLCLTAQLSELKDKLDTSI